MVQPHQLKQDHCHGQHAACARSLQLQSAHFGETAQPRAVGAHLGLRRRLSRIRGRARRSSPQLQQVPRSRIHGHVGPTGEARLSLLQLGAPSEPGTEFGAPAQAGQPGLRRACSTVRLHLLPRCVDGLSGPKALHRKTSANAHACAGRDRVEHARMAIEDMRSHLLRAT